MNDCKKWYYGNDGIEFSGFAQIEVNSHDEFGRSQYENGPFDTFSEAKSDAIARFTCDLDMAKQSLSEVRSAKARDIKNKKGV